MTKRATAGLGASVLLVAGLLAGCSDDDKGDKDSDKDGGTSGGAFADQSYDDIKQAALDAMGSLEALHVTADISSEGQSSNLDLSMSTDGSCSGSISFGPASAELLRTADGAWYKPNADLLAASLPEQTEEAIRFVGDSWVVDAGDTVSGNNCDLESFVDQLSDDEAETDTAVAGVEDLDGQDVVKLTYTNAAGDGTAYILVDGEHYIVKIETSGTQEGTAAFSEFDEKVDTEAPADDEIVDLADFEE
jgi:hypothetical protein